MYANVIIEYPVKSLDKCFTYKVPEHLLSIIKVGHKVVVPFNKGVINGIVLSLSNEMPSYETKEIFNIENPMIYLNLEQMQMGKFIKETTLCTLISAYQAMLPSALKIKNQEHKFDKYITFIELVSENEANKYIINYPKRAKQIIIIEELLKFKKLLKKDYNSESLRTLIKNGIVKEVHEKVYRLNNDKNDNFVSVKLNEEQEKAYLKVKSMLNEYHTFLLEGVTGSGKTEVYMNLISDVLDLGKSAIVLVPEICLTTQTVKRFYDRFGSNVAVFHSGLSNGEKYDEYLKIYNDEVKIVVGTRSSIFVPLKNLGLIIIDEEHSDTYKQDSNPRYDAKEVAIWRATRNNIPLIMASATPCFETKARAMKGVYEYLTLKTRANNKCLPKTFLVDMVKEMPKQNTIFSSVLQDKINERLNKKEQIILLLNRRGFSTFINCSSCGFTYKCPNCDITLTYHKTTNNLRCHMCGYLQKKDDKCPSCQNESLNYLGLGTQKVEEVIHNLFPLARVIRMDQDTTSKKGDYQRIIDDFGDNKYDILLGTQMISKGLNFDNVTLVGVINADTSLMIPDFRASERTFALLYQTSGRAGRAEKEGEVILQTYNIDNPVLNYVKNNDFSGFYKYEMDIRHKLMYPPYTYITLIMVKSKSYEHAGKEANNIRKMLNGLDSKTLVMGPTPASVFKINNVYNFQITIKYTFDNKLKETLKLIDERYISNNLVNVEITFNPSRF